MLVIPAMLSTNIHVIINTSMNSVVNRFCLISTHDRLITGQVGTGESLKHICRDDTSKSKFRSGLNWFVRARICASMGF